MELAFTDIVTADDPHPHVITATHLLREGARQLTFFRSYGPLRRSLLRGSRFDQLELFTQITPLDEPIGPSRAATLSWEWLDQAAYGVDEGDGASYKGWRVFNQRYGLVDNHGDAFIAVRPTWIYLSK